MEKLNIAAINPNEENPRFITDAKFKKLVKSIKDFPEMLEARPLVIDEDNVVLGGNMRLKALKSAGVMEVPVKKVIGWSEQQKREFVIKDNLSYGEWDYDLLANQWHLEPLNDWGLNIWEAKEDYFDLDNSPAENNSSQPSLADDDYSKFEIIMRHDNKIKFLKILSDIKQDFYLEKQEDSILKLIEIYNERK